MAVRDPSKIRAPVRFRYPAPFFARRMALRSFMRSMGCSVTLLSYSILCSYEWQAFTIMYFVYILKSIYFPKQIYVGWTSDIKERLVSHNSGASKHTSKFKPWKLIWFCSFLNQTKAIEFEKYLKSSSGIAFRRKRLMS